MSINLRQNGKTAKLSNVTYCQPEGFQESNTWHVSAETINAESDIKLTSGEATIQYGSAVFLVTVEVVEFEVLPGEQAAEDEPASFIEIGCADGLPKLALALGLLGNLSSKQKRTLLGPT